MLLALVFVSLLCVSTIQGTLEERWSQWKSNHRKNYLNAKDEEEHKDIWLRNYLRIVRHNHIHQDNNYSLAMNQFSDMVSWEHFDINLIIVFLIKNNFVGQSEAEFKTSILYPVESGMHGYTMQYVRSNTTEYPSSMDWRERGFVTEVSSVFTAVLGCISTLNDNSSSMQEIVCSCF